MGRLVAATPLPLNVLASPALPPVEELARLGVARVSSGSGPARIALSAAYAAAQELLASPGTYGDGSELSYAEVNRIMNGP
jgi:2-methylisocitrate lyase-like PEP mutase family enzyme